MHDWEFVSIHQHMLSKFQVKVMLGVNSKMSLVDSLSVRNERSRINPTLYELIQNCITFIKKGLLHNAIIVLK
jgi:hypothetical protein